MVNVHAFGASEAYSPAMAVGGFFVPFANFVVPCIAMSEIRRASAGLWREQRASPLVGAWWALRLGMSLAGGVPYVVSSSAGRTVSGLQGLILFSIVFTVGEIARNLAIYVLVARVHAMQEARHGLADNFGTPALTPS